MKDDIIYWLRWLCVFPGAIVMAFISTFPLHWILYFLFNGLETEIGSIKFFVQLFGYTDYRNIEYLLTPPLIAFVFIFTGYKIAPYHYLKTAMVLFIIYIISFLLLSYYVTSQGNYHATDFMTFLRPILALIGATSSLYYCYRDDKSLR